MGIYPPLHVVRQKRLDANLTLHDLGALMGGYSKSYISSVENELLPVTEEFSTRFWDVFSENGTARQRVEVVAPTGMVVPGSAIGGLIERRM